MTVSVEEKQMFLQWFLTQFEPFEMEWLIEEFIEDESILKRIQFVDYLEHCPKGIEITVDNNKSSYFLFKKGNIKTRNIYTAYHELQLYREEICYIQFNFPNKNENKLYTAIIEPDRIKKEENKEYIESMLRQIQMKVEKDHILNKIDQALEDNDQALFYQYSDMLQKLR